MNYSEVEYLIKGLYGLDILLKEMEEDANTLGIKIIKDALDDCQDIIGEAVINASPEVRRSLQDV